MKKIQIKTLMVIFVLSLVLGIINPLALEMKQRILLSALLFTVMAWATEAMHKSWSCLFLLLAFSIFGSTPPNEIFSFIWSPTMLLIVTTTLLSVGVLKLPMMDRVVSMLFKGHRKHVLLWLLLLPYLLSTLLVFVIPQVFARVILLATIYDRLLLARNEVEGKVKQILLFHTFLAVSITQMFFQKGDIVLNQAALDFAGTAIRSSLDFWGWIRMMALPSLAVCVVVLAVVWLLFRKELRAFQPSMLKDEENSKGSFKGEIPALVTMLVIVVLWTTEGLHQLPAWAVASVGVLLFFLFRILQKEDFKSINLHFLLFLMTVFSIGKVLSQSGITQVMLMRLEPLLPKHHASLYLLVLSLIVMLMHTGIGSAVATLSVVIPFLVPASMHAGYSGEVVTLIAFILVNIHFYLPFHHATMMIGAGKNYYPESMMIRYGVVMTVLSLLIIFGLYLPWWNLLGVL